MKTIKLAALLPLFLLSATLWTSCTDDDLVADPTPDLKGFEQVELSGELELVILPGDFDVQVAGSPDDMNDYKLRVSGDRLIGKYDDSRQHGKLSITVSLPDINYLKLSGKVNGSLLGFNDAAARAMEIVAEGNVTLHAAVDCETMELATFGNSTVRLLGKAQHFDLNLEGISDLDAFAFSSKTCHIQMEGTGDAEVLATDELTGKLEGKCTLTYDGDPATVDVEVQGDCDVVKR
jgi:Putative auto-transporter adhesin, head GIN domain